MYDHLDLEKIETVGDLDFGDYGESFCGQVLRAVLGKYRAVLDAFRKWIDASRPNP